MILLAVYLATGILFGFYGLRLNHAGRARMTNGEIVMYFLIAALIGVPVSIFAFVVQFREWRKS